jgi:RimJ/RimL family protein N-acetyltransferase
MATQALAALLCEVAVRPLYARAATDNVASLRVLAKCGFRVVGKDKGFSNARGREVEETILRLAAVDEATGVAEDRETHDPCFDL